MATKSAVVSTVVTEQLTPYNPEARSPELEYNTTPLPPLPETPEQIIARLTAELQAAKAQPQVSTIARPTSGRGSGNPTVPVPQLQVERVGGKPRSLVEAAILVLRGQGWLQSSQIRHLIAQAYDMPLPRAITAALIAASAKPNSPILLQPGNPNRFSLRS